MECILNFQKYFNYAMGDCICGIPYIILEGTAEDFQKIKEKAEKLSKYEFDWYISRIIPHIQKMIDAKNGKVDNDYFRDIIKRNEVKDNIMLGCTPEDAMISNITGWILDFFAYERTKDDKEEIWINYYVQIYPESGLGIFSYIAPASDPELYREDYERIVNSLTADSDGNQEANAHTYVLNRSTGVFHKPSCYKVKQIEDAENIEGTAEDLIAQGYSGCGICNPR